MTNGMYRKVIGRFMKLLKIKISIILILLFVCFCLLSCDNNNKIINNSVYNHIMNMKPVLSYDKNQTIDDFDTLTLGGIEQYGYRNGEKQGIEWLLLYKDEEKALFQSKYIIAVEPYLYEKRCATFDEYIKSNNYAEYNKVCEWVNGEFKWYIDELNEEQKRKIEEERKKMSPEELKKQQEINKRTLEAMKKLVEQGSMNYNLNRVYDSSSNFVYDGKSDRELKKSPYIYDWLDNKFINKIFNEEEKSIIKTIDVTEYNFDLEEIVKKRKLTLMTYEDSNKYYGEIGESKSTNFDNSVIENIVNNKIKTKVTRAVSSMVNRFDDKRVIYRKAGNSEYVSFDSEIYYLNSKITEKYNDAMEVSSIGIGKYGTIESLSHHYDWSRTSNVWGGPDSNEGITIYGVRPCMWIDLEKAKDFKYIESVDKYDEKLNNIKKNYSENQNDDWDGGIIASYSNIIYENQQNDIMPNDATISELNETVFFGSYEQDGNLKNGAENIEWIVLGKEDGKCLLFSKYIIESEIISDNIHVPVYEDTIVRKKLINEYFDKFFNDEEKNIVESHILYNYDYPYERYNKNNKAKSEDKIFLLSIEDVRRYYGDINSNIDKLKTKATNYVKDIKSINRKINDIDIEDNFWLRSSEANYSIVRSLPIKDILPKDKASVYSIDIDVNNRWANVDENGQVCYVSAYVESDSSNRGEAYTEKKDFIRTYYSGVRPAIWVNEEKLKEYSKNHVSNKYEYVDSKINKNVYSLNDIEKAKCLSEYSSRYGYDDFDTVVFGKNNFNNDNQESNDIEWFVVDKNEERILLMSKYILGEIEMLDYSNDKDLKEQFFEETNIYKWLNEDFLNRCFSKDDIDKIMDTTYHSEYKLFDYGEKKYKKHEHDINSKVLLLNKDIIGDYFVFKNGNEIVYDRTMSEYYSKPLYKDTLLVAKKYDSDSYNSYWLMENVDEKSYGGLDIINILGLVDYDSGYYANGIRPLIAIDAKKVK